MRAGVPERLLLINIGNSRCTVMSAVGSRYHPLAEAPSDAADPERMLSLSHLPHFSGAVLCSVRPFDNPAWIRTIRAQLKLDPLIIRWDLPLGIPLRYSKPETLGPDRICNACAAATRFERPVAAFDFGTAITCDVVDETGSFIGGLIAPGLRVMSDYLHERTALLPEAPYRPIRRLIGRSTMEAMQIGLYRMMTGFIREMVGELRKHFGPSISLCATGGDAHRLRLLLGREGVVIVPHLTFEGMQRIHRCVRKRSVS